MAIVLNNYAPFDAGLGSNTYEDQWRAMMRRTGAPGIVRDALNGFSCFGDSTGLQVKVNTGELWGEGHWGTSNVGISTLAIAPNATGGPRKDLVVWRIDYVANTVSIDVTTGPSGGAEPALVRNTDVFEGPIAIVEVGAGVVTITSANVFDTRWYGGPTTPNTVDEFALWGDKLSTCPRQTVTSHNQFTRNVSHVFLTQAPRNVTVSAIKYYLHTLKVSAAGNDSQLRVYTGYSRHFLSDATGLINMVDWNNAGTVHIDALPAPIDIKAGQFVAIGYWPHNLSTQDGRLGSPPAVVSAEMLNPASAALDVGGRWSCVFRTGALPTSLTIHKDGNWTKFTQPAWFALA